MTEQRDCHGRFTQGNRGGPGRPPRPTETAYLSALMEACPPDTWRRVCERAVQDAQNGDSRARQWLARSLVGEPALMAPTPVVALVHAITGTDPVVEAIAKPRIERESLGVLAPLIAGDPEVAQHIRDQVMHEVAELEERVEIHE